MAAIFQTSRFILKTALSVVLLLAGQVVQAKTLPVSPTGEIRSVKEAVRLAQSYDTILIASGIYHENDIEINKPLTIIGRQNPVIDAGFKKGIFSVMAQNVLIAGLTLQNVEESFTKNYAAVRVRGGGHITVRNNTILNCYYGVYLEQTDSCTVRHNYIRGNAKQESTSGNAIHLYRTENITVADNKVSGHRDGIYLESSSNSTITGNVSQNNLRYGLHFMFSDNNSYQRNKFIRNGSGIAVMYSRNIIMTDNLFEQNWGAAAYGILLKDIVDSRIERNIFRQNTTGIYAEGSTRLYLKNNEFRNNGWAVRLLGSSEDLTFEENNFIGNTFEISTSTNYNSNNIFRGNYWSSYTGYDLNHDGTGDVAHKPVRLFSYLLEDIPTSVVLLRSLFIDLLELIEKVAPVLTPENVLDNQPSTRLNTWKS
ncbi:nitrous oxide reductase family maturation protein NosD [Adhaeribacter rhizoryzae]|uniref:Nitrous oxide reductase family maturation protein NosD n=1 Tax=Adhaeribacter rhizoryzae TaxID=2607907 RepID=A0A5M6CXR7_9BACT|nr:nitrous oxide reductase family maturation protein NosD [Adhaeribacter rhizoryzae]KAA5539981.1 nitrous oxide reductase family maturation protein NosD [Adhaeribacter rhizoryzae]